MKKIIKLIKLIKHKNTDISIARAKLCRYSYDSIMWNYDLLTDYEKKCISPVEFYQLKQETYESLKDIHNDIDYFMNIYTKL